MTFDPSLLINLLRQEAQAARLWQPQCKGAGSPLFDQGDMATHGWILESGLVKLSYVTADGQDWIKSFVADHGLFAGRDTGPYITASGIIPDFIVPSI